MKKPINYSTEQLTTAKRDFIHDLQFQCNDDGTFSIDCDMAPTGAPVDPPTSEQVLYEGAEKLTVLCFFGRQWVLWGRACALLGQQRQFLNYRIINNHDRVEVLRMDSASALQLSQYVGKACFASAKTPRARCKTIFFDYADLPNLRRSATRNKLRSKSRSDGSSIDVSPAGTPDMIPRIRPGSMEGDSDLSGSPKRLASIRKRTVSQKRRYDESSDSDEAGSGSSSNTDLSDTDLSWAGRKLLAVASGDAAVPNFRASRKLGMEDSPLMMLAESTRRVPFLSIDSRDSRRCRRRSSSTTSNTTPLWILNLESMEELRFKLESKSRRKPLEVHRALPPDQMDAAMVSMIWQ